MRSSFATSALKLAVGLVIALVIILLVNRITDNHWLRVLLLGSVLVGVHFRKRLLAFRRPR